MEFHKETGSDEEYGAFVTWLTNETAAELRSAHGHPEQIRSAIVTYLQRGYRAGLYPAEIVDFFCVSADNPIELAGYMEPDTTAAVRLFDEIHPTVVKQLYS
jgi:hypothetical protein